MPDIKVLNVGGVKDGYTPGDPADGEYALDIQVPYPARGTQGYAVCGAAMLCTALGPSLPPFCAAGTPMS